MGREKQMGSCLFRFFFLFPPYLVLVHTQGRGREKVGRKNDASVVLEGEKTVALDGGEGQVKKIEGKASLPHGVKTRMPQGCGASYGCDGW